MFKYSKELAEILAKAVQDIEIKQTEGQTVYKMIISKEVEDRDGEIIKLDGMDSKNYMKNPVVLVDHSYRIESIVGKTIKLYVEGKNLIADFIFAEGTEYGDLAKKLYDGGFLKTSSIGFMIYERDANNRDLITKWQLLEWSLVAVPCNPDALSQDGKMLYEEGKTKGLIKEEIEQKIWDTTENEFRYRIREPELFESDSFRTITFQKQPMIRAIVGRLKGETTLTLQALRFAKSDWTLADAKAWVEAHKDTIKKEYIDSTSEDILEIKSDLSEMKILLKDLADKKAENQKDDELLEKKKTLQAIDNAVGEALKNFKLLKK